MTGYKALPQTMVSTYGNKKYELGKWYYIRSEIAPGQKGFHFSRRMEHIEWNGYRISDSRIFEIETGTGNVKRKGKGCYCSDKIRLVRELSREEIREYFEKNKNRILKEEEHNGFLRRIMARQGACLDTLINDTHELVRAEVANQGYGLDTLINDKSWVVRSHVAKQGYGIDILLDDANGHVRQVARDYLDKQNAQNKQEKKKCIVLKKIGDRTFWYEE